MRGLTSFYPDPAKLSCYLEDVDDNVKDEEEILLGATDDPMLDDIVVDYISNAYFSI